LDDGDYLRRLCGADLSQLNTYILLSGGDRHISLPPSHTRNSFQFRCARAAPAPTSIFLDDGDHLGRCDGADLSQPSTSSVVLRDYGLLHHTEIQSFLKCSGHSCAEQVRPCHPNNEQQKHSFHAFLRSLASTASARRATVLRREITGMRTRTEWSHAFPGGWLPEQSGSSSWLSSHF
jgi:hypothetical protein